MEVIASSFEAKARRPWTSSGDILRTTRLGSGTWLDANVTVADGKVTVSTPVETIEFKPSRLSWREQDEFSISGVDKGRFRRTILRFSNSNLAQSAASMLRKLESVVEEPLAGPEIPLEVRYEVPRFPKNLFAILALLLFAPGIFLITLATYFPTASVYLFAIVVVFIIFARWPMATLVLRRKLDPGSESRPSQTRLTRPYKGWLSQPPLRLRTNYSNMKLNPTAISWKDSTTLVLTSAQSTLHLGFSTPEVATRAFETVLRNMQEASTQSPKPTASPY